MITKKILIVEDEAIVAMQIEESLKQMGYEVVGVASRGNDAIRIAKDTWPDLILMDIRLDGSMDGVETANTINQYYNIPVIFLTAYSDDSTVSRVIKTCSYGFLTKPFNDRELYSNIELAIGKHSSLQKNQVEETILSSIFSLIPDAVIAAGPDGTLRKLNDHAKKLWGWGPEEMAHHNILSILDAGVTDMETFLDILAGMKTTNIGLVRWPENVIVTTDTGDVRRFALTIEQIHNADGNLRELILVLTHPIGRESLEASAVTPRQVIDIISDPIFFMDSQMNLVLFNSAYQEFCSVMSLGAPAVNKPVSETLAKTLGEGTGGYRSLFECGVAWEGVIDMKNNVGKSRYSVTKIPIFNEEQVSHMATILRAKDV